MKHQQRQMAQKWKMSDGKENMLMTVFELQAHNTRINHSITFIKCCSLDFKY